MNLIKLKNKDGLSELHGTSAVMNKVSLSLVKGWAGKSVFSKKSSSSVTHWLFCLMICAELIGLLSNRTGTFLGKLTFVFKI